MNKLLLAILLTTSLFADTDVTYKLMHHLYGKFDKETQSSNWNLNEEEYEKLFLECESCKKEDTITLRPKIIHLSSINENKHIAIIEVFNFTRIPAMYEMVGYIMGVEFNSIDDIKILKPIYLINTISGRYESTLENDVSEIVLGVNRDGTSNISYQIIYSDSQAGERILIIAFIENKLKVVLNEPFSSSNLHLSCHYHYRYSDNTDWDKHGKLMEIWWDNFKDRSQQTLIDSIIMELDKFVIDSPKEEKSNEGYHPYHALMCGEPSCYEIDGHLTIIDIDSQKVFCDIEIKTSKSKIYKYKDGKYITALDYMPFTKAFRKQYLDKGEGHTFWWRGSLYTTDLSVN